MVNIVRAGGAARKSDRTAGAVSGVRVRPTPGGRPPGPAPSTDESE
ncbi:MAG: hypothetical protein ACOC9N_03500 [Gemmatimonadota bacterium]